MRISNCRTVVTCPGRNFVLVRIETDTGLIGWGDATLNGRELAVAAALDEHLYPLLMGEDPLRIEHIWQGLRLGGYWRGGPVLNTALAGIDMALWDILGREAGMPVYQLLGGRVREGALAYVSTGGPTPQIAAERVKQRLARGFRAVRVQAEATAGSAYSEKIVRRVLDKDQSEQRKAEATMPMVQDGLPAVGEWEPAPYLRSIVALLAHVRQEAGDEVELLHDVHQRLSITEAAGLARQVEPYRLFFLEDPFGPEFVHGLAQLRAVTTTPLAMGELFYDISTCLPVISNRWIDYLRCDLGHIGGITAARKLAALAEPFGVKTAWHGPPDLAPVGHAANVHVDIATSNFGIQEWQPYAAEESHPHYAAMREVFRGGATLREGRLDVPDEPGLGIEVDENAAAKHPYRRAYLPTVRRADGSVHPW